jgi:hypothetical protein
MQRIFTKKYFLFRVGSICRVKRFTSRLRNSLRDVLKSQMMPRPCEEVAETTVKILQCCGFWRTGKAMGQVYQCRWRICREINVFPRLEYYHMLYVLCPFGTNLLTLIRTHRFMFLSLSMELVSGRMHPYIRMYCTVYLQHFLTFCTRSLNCFQIFLAAICNLVLRFNTFPISLRTWEKGGYSTLFSLFLSVWVLLPSLFHISVCAARDRYTDPYGIWRELRWLRSVTIINTNVDHKVCGLWLCSSNMENVSPQTNPLKRTHMHARISLFHSARHKFTADHVFCPEKKLCLVLRMYETITRPTLCYGTESHQNACHEGECGHKFWIVREIPQITCQGEW